MKKTLLLTLILLISAAWVVAQTSQTTSPSTAPSSNSQTSPSGSSSDQMGSQSSQQPSSQSSSDMSKMGNETHIEGCLGGSAGNYTLTDSSGKYDPCQQ
jgi:hypothetical protein